MTTQAPDPEHEPSTPTFPEQTREGAPVTGYTDRTLPGQPFPDPPISQEGEGYQPTFPTPDAEDEEEESEG